MLLPERVARHALTLLQAAQAAGDVPYRAERPFPVEIVPSHLVAKLRSQ